VRPFSIKNKYSGKYLAVRTDEDGIYLWDAQSRQMLATLTGHRGYVNGASFNPDETLLVSGSHDKTVGIWNVAGQKLIRHLEGHTDAVLRVAFNRTGTLIASISWDGTVRLWGVK
jgi:WD40 repeat protein